MTHLMSSILILADSQPWLQALGRFHVAIVHFPIALLLLAGGIEAGRAIKRKETASPTALACLIIGGVAAVASSVVGWIHKGYTGHAAESGANLQLHQWIGIASAVSAIVALALLGLRNRQRAVMSYRFATIACGVLVAIAGHYGGNLTHGEGYLTELVFNSPDQATESAVPKGA